MKKSKSAVITPMYSIGDVLLPRSGGPKLMVEKVILLKIEGYVLYRCVWFTQNHEVARDNFREELLRP